MSEHAHIQASGAASAPAPNPKLVARRWRIRTFRLRITSAALAKTTVLWVAIFGQFAAGKDPVIG